MPGPPPRSHQGEFPSPPASCTPEHPKIHAGSCSFIPRSLGAQKPPGHPGAVTRGDTGTRGEVAALKGHRLLFLPARLFLRSPEWDGFGADWDRQGTGTALGTERTRTPRGWDNFLELFIGAQAGSKNGELAPGRNFPAPHSWMKLRGRGSGWDAPRSWIRPSASPRPPDLGTLGTHRTPKSPCTPSLPHFGGSAPTWEQRGCSGTAPTDLMNVLGCFGILLFLIISLGF